jgi:hypothetical protein
MPSGVSGSRAVLEGQRLNIKSEKTSPTMAIFPPPFFQATSLTEISALHETKEVSLFPKMQQEG